MKDRKKNILFICYGNLNRSPTAADVCTRMAEEYNLNIEAVSAGIAVYSNNPITKYLADSADLIFVMEDYMKKLLQQYYGQKSEKIVVLNIPDIYPKNDPELVAILKKELTQYLFK